MQRASHRCEALGKYGGCTRARTWDPLIKSQRQNTSATVREGPSLSNAVLKRLCEINGLASESLPRSSDFSYHRFVTTGPLVEPIRNL